MKERTNKKGIRRKLFSVLLAMVMIVTLLPFGKLVANAEVASTPLTFTAEEANSSVAFNWSSGTDVQFSTDNGNTWSDYSAGTVITLTNERDTVSFKGTNVKTDLSNHFTMTGKIGASGDVTSLRNGIGGNVNLGGDDFRYMFSGCTSLTSAPSLPST